MVDDDIVTKELSINIIIRDRTATTRDDDVTYDDDAVHEELRLEFDSKVVPKVTKLKSTISESMLNQLYTIVVHSLSCPGLYTWPMRRPTPTRTTRRTREPRSKCSLKLPCGTRIMIPIKTQTLV
jgi:hypothetical protein